MMKTGIDFFIDKDVYIKHKDKTTFGNHVAIDKGFYCTTQLEVGDYVYFEWHNATRKFKINDEFYLMLTEQEIILREVRDG